ncbi:hypothetical protein [Macrococcoides caseolyticum]|uniref:hypothetical protein n=1 Tax=Macrococcoides caseolyticum TaxID=69966 RepID=UPI000C31F818|nr:hypothetical protein [Macrococcus caseolyticus]PKD98579.1 hypothetical protein CW719_07970 [Macrococcus caseolyticus]PKF18780.1 hypothetical protein CW717_07970 [Macrococcus caseolyticus]
MKKSFITLLSLGFILSGCGQQKEIQEETKQENKENSFNKNDFNDNLENNLKIFIEKMQDINELTNSTKVEKYEEGFLNSGSDIIKQAEKFEKYLNKNEINGKYKEVSNYLLTNMFATGYLFKESSELYPRIISGELDSEQAINKQSEIQKKYSQKYNTDKTISDEKFLKYLKENDIEYKEFEKIKKSDNYTTDPIKFIENNGILVDIDNNMSYEIVKVFRSEQSNKYGFNKIDNNNFVYNLAFALVKNTDTGELYLGYFGENVNNTDKNIEFLGYITFTTDTGQQVAPESGAMATSNKLIKEYNPGVKSKGYGIVPLEYQNEIPDSIKVTIDQPHNNDDTDTWGEDITIKDLK